MAASNTHSLTIDKKTERLGWLLDDVFRVPILGWRFGLVPGIGDTGTALASFYILASAVRHGVPKITLLRMGMNIGFDYLIGSVPVVGDVADVFWKSNQKNIKLLRKRATVSAEEARAGRMSDWIFVGGIIVGLIALLIASAVVSLYLLSKLLTGFT